ncbi:TonB-dependent SusC/RagA subfamily outer membrane receptor [Mucilaginibacter gracilis]|uniref:TonB-dependent SusC/RagA subfamily outer membrane receptor n=1 Tax=Mucilaginibacter gracilis TaxID=423350 RepID=A0A495J9M3_9SPHI|nr:carboxypeptidase-like regulatory domain-containing protein [Mucilaginibacter gracilis]RKR85720.1 TonB-dependent SusC/RagA subfamily outer membrane receptor [Mucilaginibacter gracilis]
MKNFLLPFLLLFVADVAMAQKPLSYSSVSSYYTYIYPVKDADVEQLYSDKKYLLDDKILGRPINSALTNRFKMPVLKPGNYLKVYVTENKLEYKLIEQHSAFIKVLDNHTDLRFVVLDTLGNELNNAEVWVKNKKVSYDADAHMYHFRHINIGKDDDASLKVRYAGVSNYFTLNPINQYHYHYHYRQPFWRKILYNTPIKYVAVPVNRWLHPQRYSYNSWQHYAGYLAFNKPMYKPGDTVKFKAYIFGKSNKKPVKQKQLLIKLNTNYNKANDKTIATVSSYRDGAFEREFVLNDSLKLTLDQNYTLSLIDPLKTTAKRTEVLITGTFRYEDYELKSVKFTARADKEEHSPGNPVAMYFKATDENDLPVADGRVEVRLVTENVNDYKSQHLFVPDTLWKHKLNLEPVGETKLEIPDSIFAKADIKYRVESVFFNSNNESQSRSSRISFINQNYKIVTRLDQDTLKISYLDKGKDLPMSATITSVDEDDNNVSQTVVNLPTKIVINPHIPEYDIKTDSVSEIVKLKDFKADISSSAYRNADSVYIKVNNPRHIPFWYTVFSGGKIMDSGKGIELFYKKAYHNSGNVFLLLNWIWGAEAQNDEVTILYRDKLLDIAVKQPIAVYPGQQVEMEVDVKNAKGKPVADADITAYSATAKFQNYYTPDIPYFGKLYPARKQKNGYKVEYKGENGNFNLNWDRWSKQMGLDSITYFKFTHPYDVYQVEETAPASLTQIAPFVMSKGEILPIYLLYIDGRPVYFNQAEQLQRYSFKVSPGKHNIKMRILKQEIVYNDAVVPQGKKLILSLNADTMLNKKVTFFKRPDTLTRYEAEQLNKYMTRIVDSYDWKMATLSQANDVFLLGHGGNYALRNGTGILAGPLAYNYADFTVHGETPRSFLVEPGYSFEFLPGLIKQKSIPGRYPFNINLASNMSGPKYNQYALTHHEVDTLWQQFLDNRSYSTALFPQSYISKYRNGKLVIKVEGYGANNAANDTHPLIKNIIVYRYNNPDYMRIYPGNTTDMGYLEPGKYRLLFLLKGDSYYIHEQVAVKANGINYYQIAIKAMPKDTVSSKIAAIINSRDGVVYNSDNSDKDMLKLKEAFNDTFLDRSTFKNYVTGRVTDKNKEAVPGATVKIKGTSIIVNTDINGYFKIAVPESGHLLIMFIGYESQEISIKSGTYVDVVLKESSKQLSEVVVVGYGTQMKRDMTGSISKISSSLMGRVAGLDITIRGTNSISTDKAPLYIIDGVVVENGMSGLDPLLIADISVLKDAAATAVYGARAANGVVIITTKKKANNNTTTDGGTPAQEQTLRKNFSDYAFWQPKLKTNEQGKAKFTVTFPDDITRWRTTVIGIAGRQTGISEGQIKSFKSLSANFVSPQFAIKGDEINPLGKVVNYTTESVNLNRVFKYNGQVIKSGTVSVKSSLIDTFKIVTPDVDSLHFEYTIKKDNGYFDGERRSIPVFEQGVLETKGTFADMEKDTTLTLKFDPALGTVTFRAEASALPVLLDETERLRNYQYLCNEQLASKLKGLLIQKRVKKYLGEPFKWDKNILLLIKKLQESRKAEGTWGWWKDGDDELWISLHAIEALLEAGQQGYAVELDKQKLIDYLVYRVNAYSSTDKLDAIGLLIKLGAKADYAALLADYQKSIPKRVKLSAYEKIRLMLVKQQAGLPVELDTLAKYKHSTMFGNLYWGENCYRFFDNAIQLSIMAYHIYKADGHHADMLPKIRNYFLEQRGADGWRNTYESALILETILPDLLSGDKQLQASQITLGGEKSETVSKFPYSTTLAANAKLTIAKKGNLPVYITAYQQYWNRKPDKISKDFTVNTWFKKDQESVTKLKGGEQVTLEAEVTARADADYVMIEIPIPAGCSYYSKEQNYWGNEVHREYFKNKVNIFCRKLKQGKYSFSIKLMPRYSGNYNLNPAKAEMMYFPVFYGREAMKKVRID